MGRTTVHRRRSPARWAALIADQGARESIVAAFERQRLSVSVFDCVDSLLADDPANDPAAVVLRIEPAACAVARLVEPVVERFASAPVVVICPEVQRWDVRAALMAGAVGVVAEEDVGSALAACLQAVSAGQICVPRENSREVAPPVLSTRERQILGLVVMGYMNGQIAEQLFLAESTVKSHLSSAFGKLGVRSRNEAVSLILDPERGLGMGILALGGEPVPV
jgi:DNA-binding NarL/FixJ family response regulator